MIYTWCPSINKHRDPTAKQSPCSFLSGRNTFFWFFLGGFMCSPNRFSRKMSVWRNRRYTFSRRIWSVCLPNRYHFSRASLCVHQTYRFSRSTFLATTKQIPIFQKHLILSSTEQITIFQEAFFEYQRTDRQFPGRYLLRTDI